ncbi:conserved hypothetical protein [Gloeothece citriformis PCC 7424]|uniref:DUF389 domain-containing protein n=1 Tax=Gloeothece citriformis (strain PCC 7424) TaxID=65393 RepID=B7KAU4_GLOC7|nr:DUF389 domain-containing protein [Gloeothece citriformis]ACK68766.1 conserved hypothetical protein [Gloeothece citriformis PCC 7424]
MLEQPQKPLVVSQILSIGELNISLEEASLPSISFYALLGLATTIASLGLLGNNTATIIGAMIVAPLMNPIVTLAYGIISGKKRFLLYPAIAIVTGTLLVVLFAFVLTNLLGTQVVGGEILGRTAPNLIDLGVAIASGSAAGLAYSRRNISSALPGVAIAVALVPPLCVTGIGLALGNDAVVDIGLSSRFNDTLDIAAGSFLLFLTNLGGIVFSAGFVFLLQGYGILRKAIVGLSLTLVIVAILSLPLNYRLQEFLFKNRIIHSLNRFGNTYVQEKDWIERTDAKNIYVDNQQEQVYIKLNIVAPEMAFSQEDFNRVKEFLSQDLNKPVTLDVQLFTFEIFN